jgi:streptomycin 6-kinase
MKLNAKIQRIIGEWRVDVDHITETETSILAFGQRDELPVVLKVIKNHGDEWRSGEIVNAFEGRGVVRIYEYTEGAMLLERLLPGQPLSILDDDEASFLLASTIKKMSPGAPMDFAPTVEIWGKAFERYAVSGDNQIPRDLLMAAQHLYTDLCQSQKHVRLLHGDLHHSNILFDTERNWIAIDPKGVVGELEYELGAALRNPIEKPALFTNPIIIQKRAQLFSDILDLNYRRILSWAFAQAVLSEIWSIEDGFQMDLNWIQLSKQLGGDDRSLIADR